MKDLVLEKLKELNLGYSFELFEEGVAKVVSEDVEIFVEYFTDTDTYMVFDGGYTTVECLERFGDTKDIYNKMKTILEKYQINKEQESMYIECSQNEVEINIEKLIKIQEELLV